jgi:cysteine desulfurase
MSRSQIIYLDYNATTPAKVGVAEAMQDALAIGGNPSSVHQSGRAARQVLEAARQTLASLTGARSQDVVFTSGGTEANRISLMNCGRPRRFASAVEHASVAALCSPQASLAVDPNGRLDLQQLEDRARSFGPDVVVSVMLANNETGVLQPVAEAAEIVHASGGLLHCDAVQGLEKVPIDIMVLHADLLTVSAHKIGGPAGTGAVILAPGVELSSDRMAGGQEQGRRPGTENLAGVAGFHAALGTVPQDLAAQARVASLRDRLEAMLGDAALIFGAGAPRLANTSCLAMPGVAAETQVMAFDLAGFCVSAGAACSSGKVQASPVLAAMGVPDDVARTAIRVSIGVETVEEEIDSFAAAWKQLFRRKRAA